MRSVWGRVWVISSGSSFWLPWYFTASANSVATYKEEMETFQVIKWVPRQTHKRIRKGKGNGLLKSDWALGVGKRCLFVNQVLLEHGHVHWCMCCLWLFSEPQWQVWVVVTETLGPTEPKIFPLSPLAEKVYPWYTGKNWRLGGI